MHKSIYDFFIKDLRSVEKPEETKEASDKIITVANAMTLGRPVVAAYAAHLMIAGQKGALMPTIITGALDMDGKVARIWDKLLPDSDRGATKFGAKADTYADFTALLLLAGGILRGPRIPFESKVATSIVIGQELTKAAWAASAQLDYKGVGGQGELYIVPTSDARAAMAEKFTTFAAAAAANDADNPVMKHVFGAASMYFGVTGALRGNQEVGKYKLEAAELIRELQTDGDMPTPQIYLPPRVADGISA